MQDLNLMFRKVASPLAKLHTMLRLAPQNILRVALYRSLLRAGIYRRFLSIGPVLRGPFFEWPKSSADDVYPECADAAAWGHDAERVIGGELPVFSNNWVRCGFPPKWHFSVISHVEMESDNKHWTQLRDFDLPGGDIKGYWEPARFEGLVILSLGWIHTRREAFQRAIEEWLASWCAENPVNKGVQWKCGQEAGLRILHTILAADLLERWVGVSPREPFCDLVTQHCERIAPTMLYAIAQENNHGTSEAAALFVGGAFLIRHGSPHQETRAKRWHALGRHWLEDRLQRLVLHDGSFSQHSVNYHRLMLDTYSLTETLRRQWGIDGFTQGFYERCRVATDWLAGLTDSVSGDAPNLGANDGARMFVLHRCVYRDYRPSVQWASVLFFGRKHYSPGPYDEVLQWLHLGGGEQSVEEVGGESRIWSDGGYAKLATSGAWLLLRLPHYRFRPSQSDALHLDLWVDGQNILRDGGSYSYNVGDEWLDYFGGVESHNTVQFDHRNQMPRISRFLFADWLKCFELCFVSKESTVVAAYQDSWGAEHKRSISLLGNTCEVIDEVKGFDRSAIVRWRLVPVGQEWKYVDGAWRSGRISVVIESSIPLRRLELTQGWESRMYGEKTVLPVLEAEVSSAAKIVSTITW